MKMKTKYFGEFEYGEDEVIHFPHGIFGFEDCTSFIIIRFDNDNDGFLCLQSTTDEMLAFVLLNPFYAEPEYAPKLTDDDLKMIEAGSETPLLLYAIAVVREKLEESTVNLKCPLVVNTEKRIAAQVIADTDEYSLRHPLVKSFGYSSEHGSEYNRMT